MENICEKCIVKPKNIKDNIITLFVVLGTLAVAVVSFITEVLQSYSVAIIIVAIFIAYKLITDRNIEFEYILAGNSFSLDKILNKRRRKRLINCDLSDFDIVAPVKSRYYDEYEGNSARVITAVSGDFPDLEYFGLVEYKGKRTMIMFETDDKALAHIKKHLKYKLKN